jgi:hypothetical protein
VKDVFAHDLIFFPLHEDRSHWALAVVNMKARKIQYYDSVDDGLGAKAKQYLPSIKKWMQSEHASKKKGAPFDFTGWDDCSVEVCPQQDNGFRCWWNAWLKSSSVQAFRSRQATAPVRNQWCCHPNCIALVENRGKFHGCMNDNLRGSIVSSVHYYVILQE